MTLLTGTTIDGVMLEGAFSNVPVQQGRANHPFAWVGIVSLGLHYTNFNHVTDPFIQKHTFLSLLELRIKSFTIMSMKPIRFFFIKRSILIFTHFLSE